MCAAPTGLGLIFDAFPARKRWAKLFRVASEARVLPSQGHAGFNALRNQTIAVKVSALPDEPRDRHSFSFTASETADPSTPLRSARDDKAKSEEQKAKSEKRRAKSEERTAAHCWKAFH